MVLTELGFPEPGPMPRMKLEHQIAQKLHAVSGAGSERAHDLIDLQIIVNNGDVDHEIACRTCERLFAHRKEQAWPPTIAKGEGWDDLYAAQAEGLGVLETADETVTWANALVARISSSTQDDA